MLNHFKKIFLLLVMLLPLACKESTSSANSFSIEVTAIGIDGTVVLQNNGKDSLEINQSGKFIFDTFIQKGGTYNVTVLKSPAKQTCTISHGKGTVSGNVTSVKLACSVNAYTVGGTVSGLNGTLILQNNLTDDLTVVADGNFTFSTPIADASDYDVTILQFPGTQGCTVSQGTGTIASANVSKVAIVCANKAWVHPSGLTDNISPNGQSVSGPQVAMDSNGNTIIVWSQSDGANPQIFKSEYRNGTWVYPSSLSDYISPSGHAASSVQVAMDNNGNAIIVWIENNGTNDQVFKSEYRNGAWVHPVDVNDNISPDGQSVTNPQVAMDNNGNAIIVWSQNDGANPQIFKSEYRNGVWTHPSGLSDNISPDGQNTTRPQVVMDNNGNAIITWYQSDGLVSQIFKSEYRNGTWVHPSSLSDNISPDGQNVALEQVAMDNNGNAIIVWYESDGVNAQIFKSEYRNGTWVHPSSLSDNISPDGQPAQAPQVAMDSKGNAIITWYQNSGTAYEIYKSEYRNGAWTNPSGLSDHISPSGSLNSFAEQVAMDENGSAIITWYQSVAGTFQIFKSEYRDGVWTNPANINDFISPSGQVAASPQVAMDNNGNAVIVWSQNDGSNTQVFKSEYR